MREYTLKPLSRAEQLYAYKQSQQIAGQTGCFGYYHGDFGESGVDYNAVWFGNSNTEMTDDFRNDLAEVMEEFGNESKAVHPFADRKAMSAFCLQNRNAAMKGNFSEEYGFRLDTERYSYFIRMEPHQKGDYDFYVFAYDKRLLDRHMKKAAKDIKFIRSDYSLKFKLEDGDKIMIKYSDGETKTQECRYIDEYHTQIGGSIYHICQFAELIERNRATVIPYRDSLPEKCYVYVDTHDIYAIVTKGKDGYEPFEQAKYPDKERNREYVAKLNRELGVTDKQVGAMTMAAMFGWADKDADPRSFNGGKSHNNRNRDDYER